MKTLKIRRSAPEEKDLVNDLLLGPIARPSGRGPFGMAAHTMPMEIPYDRQCIIRFPANVADEVRRLLGLPGTTELTEILKIKVEEDPVDGHPVRVYSVSVMDSATGSAGPVLFELKGLLVDLPTFVESYKTVNNGVTLTKSSDVSQILVCFHAREFVPPYKEEIKRLFSLLFPSGLSPPTANIRSRKFRPPPSKKDIQNLRSAEDLIDNVMTGGALEWVVETEAPEEEQSTRALTEPDNVWTPTPEILNQLRAAGFIDAEGNIIEEGYDDTEDEERSNEVVERQTNTVSTFTGAGKGGSIVFSRK